MGFGSFISSIFSQKAAAQGEGIWAPAHWITDHALMPTVERVGQATQWLYTNAVSHPVSTALMAGEEKNGPFSAQSWSTAWNAARHISPGQALFLSPQQTQAAANAPLDYYKPAESMLPAGFDQLPEDQQQQLLKQAGMPAIGNSYVDNLRRESTLFERASGTADFALNWWADPTTLAGKAAGGLKDVKFLKAPTPVQAGKYLLYSRQLPRDVAIPLTRPATGWSASDINTLMSHSTMAKAQDFIYANRANPALLNNLQMAKTSALGPRFGAIASTLKSPGEVADFLRVGMGDLNATDRLTSQNLIAAGRIEQDTDRLSRLNLARAKYTDMPNLQALVTRHMNVLTQQINADTQLVSRYNQILDHAGEIDKVNLSRWSFARAAQRTEAQGLYRAGGAVGGGALRQRLPQGMQQARVIDGKAQYISTPLDGGMVKSRLWGLGDFFSTPVTLVRSLGNFKPNGYMRLDDIDQSSVNELRGQLARIPGITMQTRQKFLNAYLQTQTESDRRGLLDEVGRLGAAKIAAKHGLAPELGQELYQAHMARQLGEVENAQRFSAAWKPGPGGTPIRVDEFADDGGKLSVHPNLVTRLSNDYVMQDLDTMDTVLARHASPLSALRTSTLGNPDWIKDGADYLTHMFKFATLFRLGYIPRVLGDDVAGQWARAGSAAMAARVGWGVRNGITNAARAWARPFNAAQEQIARQGVDYADSELADLEGRMAPLQAQIAGWHASNATDLAAAKRRVATAKNRIAGLSPIARPTTRSAMQQLLAKRQAELQVVQQRIRRGLPGRHQALQALQDHHDFLTQYRDLSQRKAEDAAEQQQKVIQGSKPVMVNGIEFPAAFGGESGKLYQALLSPDEELGNVFATNKQLIHGNLMRSFDHGGRVIRASENEDLHATSWANAINTQLVQDELAKQAIEGKSPEQMTRWLTHTPAGQAYRKRLGVKFAQPDDIANSAWHEAAEYLPTPDIRQAALSGQLTPDFLKRAVPNMVERPEVHTGMVGIQGQSKYKRALDRVIQPWYKFASTIPAERMSRHPLFNQLYEGHVKKLTDQAAKQGGWTVSDVDGITQAARRLALRDTRSLVFDIAHRTDASAALRFISPFFAPTAEAFQRWGRIIADRPQVVGYMADFFNAPLSAGVMQDSDGNTIMRDGTIIDPVTGKRTLVPKDDRYIVARLPKWLADSPVGAFLGAEPASGNMRLSQNSVDMLTQGDPWFNPGVGPAVSIPVNELVKDKPAAADMAQKLGVLPFGPDEGGALGDNLLGRAADQMMPATVKNFLTAFDTSDDRYQAVKLQITQRAAYEHAELGKPMPSAKQIAAQVRDYWMFTAASAFLQAAGAQRSDQFQFYRDQYNNLLRANPMTADQQFLAKFGESYFVFAQSQSQNATGVPATQKAVALEKRYADLLAANPDLGALIVGPEGNGPFSPGAYAYQLNTPIAPGSSEMQRTKMSADQAMQENQARLGWAKYTAKMNQLGAELRDRGLKSFSDDGAQDLKAQKSAWTELYASPLYPDGTVNPYYNAAWSQQYSDQDPLKYDRMIPGLTELANSPLADQPQRSDLRTLQQYLGGRQQILQVLQQRAANGGAKTLGAQSNSDLALAWQQFVDGLVESDTRFGDLVSRYLSRDLGIDELGAGSASSDSEAA